MNDPPGNSHKERRQPHLESTVSIMAMRVRLQTSPLGMCFRIGGLVLLGGVTSLVVEHSEWFQTVKATQQQTAAPQPSPTPTPAPTPKPSAVKLAAAPLPAHATTPPGWTNFFGIMIPPPGYNDHR